MASPAQPIEQLFEKIRHLPPERITEVKDFVDFISERVQHQRINSAPQKTLDFPVISVGQWPQELNLSREGIYDDDGR